VDKLNPVNISLSLPCVLWVRRSSSFAFLSRHPASIHCFGTIDGIHKSDALMMMPPTDCTRSGEDGFQRHLVSIAAINGDVAATVAARVAATTSLI